MLRKILISTWEEERGSWRTFNNGEVHDFHSSPNTVRVITSGRSETDRKCGTYS
jgi:hypothetical protein